MRLRVAALLLPLVACSEKTEGPTPKVDVVINPLQRIVSPARICNAQGAPEGWRLEIVGSRFAPVPRDTLTDTPDVALPEVTLRGPATLTLDPESVFFARPELLRVDVPTRDTSPAHQLPAGTYTVAVKNPLGGTGELADSLVIVDPPTVTGVTAPEGFSFSSASPLVIEGTGFQPGTFPAVSLRSQSGVVHPLFTLTVTSATRIDTEIPPGTPEGTYDLVLSSPEGCGTTRTQALTITYPRLGTLTVDPAFGWQRRNQAITLYNTPTGDQWAFSSGAPEVYLVAPLKTAPTELVNIPLRRVASVSSSVVTAVVPTCSGFDAVPITAEECPNGIVPGGPYALRVFDSGGAVGEVPAAAGFSVVTNEPPTLESITPGSTETGGLDVANPLVIRGRNFADNAQVQLLKQLDSGNVLACLLPVIRPGTATELRTPVPSSLDAALCTQTTPTGAEVTPNTVGLTLSPGLFVVRVRNPDDGAFGSYSGLVVTNASANPMPGRNQAVRLATARADFPLVSATDDLGQPFLYALGGTDGTQPLASVEVAQVTPFGDLAGACANGACAFRALDRAALGLGTAGTTPVPRRGHTAVVRGVEGDTSYVFVLGGADGTGAAVPWVERAQVLRVADAPATPTTDFQADEAATLAAGTFYYRVSAVLRDDDAKNPGGETLPSDLAPVRSLGAGNTVALAWPCMTGAVRYRVYRTATPNQLAHTEQLLDEVAAPACTGSPLPQVTYLDTGAKAPTATADRPQPPGALGRWVRLATGLEVPRANAATRAVGDTVYVTGGFCDAPTTPGCTGTLRSIERATFSGDRDAAGPTLGAFAVAGDMTRARQRHALAVADAATAPASFASTSPDNQRDAWLLVVGGDAGGAPLTNSGGSVVETARVRDAGGVVDPLAFTGLDKYASSAMHGGWAEVAANGFFVSGATGGTGLTFRSGYLCESGGRPGACTSADSLDTGLNSTGGASKYQEGGPRYLNGSTLFRAFVYVAGGLSSDTPAGTPTSAVESILY